MPVVRPTRVPPEENVPLRQDSDDGGDTEEEETTPVGPQRSLAKKRLSERFVLDQANSSFSESGRVPLQSVNINDDEAEKRKRRKSAKVVAPLENAEAGPSSEGNAQGQEAEGSGQSAQARQKQQLASVAQTPIINVPLDVMSSNFEEWMKMATDNKINAANSWNFALIDYFHDMSLLRNNTDNSINFQRASCTLDGCVKIWTSRVDSVGTETGKLLSNLANEGTGGDDEEGNGSDNPDGHDPSQTQRKRKTHRSETTLAKSVAQLRNKKLDLEFSVDPLFSKTSADFDEGGANGLLMNHLSLGVGSEGSLRVVFDASDSMGKGDDDDDDIEEPEDEIDLSELRKQFLPSLEDLDDKVISESIGDFAFSKDAFSFDDTAFFQNGGAGLDADDDDNEDNEPAPGMDDQGYEPQQMDLDDQGGVPPAEDFFAGDEAIGGDFNGGEYDAGSPHDEDPSSQGQSSMPGEGGPMGAFVPFDPRNVQTGRDFVLAMEDGDEGSGLMTDYFDQSIRKNWAGPEHWKLRKAIRRPEPSDAAGPKPKREKKEAFKIDFLTPSEKDVKTLAKELFEPVTKGAGITLPGPSGTRRGRGKRGKDKDKRSDQTLPDDMHFSSRQLVTLFLKPKFSLKMRGRRGRGNEPAEGEVDENFWAQAAAQQAAGRGDEDGDETAGDGGIPFNTQFFHDDYDEGPGFDDVFDGPEQSQLELGEQDLLAATQGKTRRVRPETVNYARRAKRVDVRKLKENIWKGLDIIVPDFANQDEKGPDEMDIDEEASTDPAEPRVFNSVITGLQKAYPRDKMEEISTSFCFICLLHLANERGLKLETGTESMREVESEDHKIGNIWNLKVYRDPDAFAEAM